jgi:hypothetical protein
VKSLVVIVFAVAFAGCGPGSGENGARTDPRAERNGAAKDSRSTGASPAVGGGDRQRGHVGNGKR